MSEITKLYENANIEKEVIKGCYEYYSENGGIDIYTVNDCQNKDCNTCKADKSIKEYPPFTAEKQLELIKWCLDNYRGYIFDSIETEWFEEQLCAFINNIWQDLTEEEKQQVKGILE